MASKTALRADFLRQEAGLKLPEASPSAETTVEVITPDKAAEWVGRDVNCHNRNLNSRRMMGYARDMQEGRWLDNNDAICFDIDGVLINGQHRLHACIVAQTSFRAIVRRGMPRESQDVMDQQGVRSIAGMLQLRNFVNTTRLAGAMRSLVDLAHAGDGFKSYRPTNKEIIALIDQHPLLVESVAVAHSCRGISPALLAAVHYVGKVLLDQPEKADAFLEVMNKGIPAYKGDPAHILRENTLRHQERSTRKADNIKFFAMIRAWNAFVDEERWGKWMPPRPGTNITIKGLKPEMI